MNVEFVRTYKGIMAVHRHYLPDGRLWWAGFVKHGQYEGVWEQFHLSAYGKFCPHCKKLFPRDEALEEGLRKAVEAAGGVEGLKEMDLRTGEVK